MKKIINEVNKYAPGKFKQNGSKLDWYVEEKKLKTFSFPSSKNMWWFLKGILAMKKIGMLYCQERRNNASR